MMPGQYPIGMVVLCTAVITGATAKADNVVDHNRLQALQEAVSTLGHPAESHRPPDNTSHVYVCWTPHGQFSPVGVTSQVAYGVRGLAARYESTTPIRLSRNAAYNQPVLRNAPRFRQAMGCIRTYIGVDPAYWPAGRDPAQCRDGGVDITEFADFYMRDIGPALGSNDMKTVASQSMTIANRPGLLRIANGSRNGKRATFAFVFMTSPETTLLLMYMSPSDTYDQHASLFYRLLNSVQVK